MNDTGYDLSTAPHQVAWAQLQRVAAPAGDGSLRPRVLLVFAHPDDEVLAVGGRLERFGLSRFLTITDGAPTNGEDARQHGFDSLAAYRAARRAELLSALMDAGLPEETAPIFRAAVADQKASFHLLALAGALAEEIAAFAPEAVLTHPYEGGHPDHDACAFAVHTAVALAAGAGSKRVAPLPILEAPSYHADGQGGMVTGSFLPWKEAGQDLAITQTLGPEESRRKQRRIDLFPSQRETLMQFGMDTERYRLAPQYDFRQRPHAGRLFYEQFSWGMSGDRFCELAEEAMGTMQGHRELPKSPAAER